MTTEPRYGEMWEWGQWRMMFVRRGDSSDPATTYWVMLEYRDDVTLGWSPALLPKVPRPMSSFGTSDWKKVEA